MCVGWWLGWNSLRRYSVLLRYSSHKANTYEGLGLVRMILVFRTRRLSCVRVRPDLARLDTVQIQCQYDPEFRSDSSEELNINRIGKILLFLCNKSFCVLMEKASSSEGAICEYVWSELKFELWFLILNKFLWKLNLRFGGCRINKDRYSCLEYLIRLYWATYWKFWIENVILRIQNLL